MKDRGQCEALRAALWQTWYEDLHFVLKEKHDKILVEAGKEYVRRLKEQEERLREELTKTITLPLQPSGCLCDRAGSPQKRQCCRESRG